MIRHLLNTFVEVQRQHTESDGMGGETVTVVTVGSFPAKVDQATLREEFIASQLGSTHSHNVYFSSDADVRRDDRLTEGGRTLRVLSTTRPSRAVYLKAECELRERGV